MAGWTGAHDVPVHDVAWCRLVAVCGDRDRLAAVDRRASVPGLAEAYLARRQRCVLRAHVVLDIFCARRVSEARVVRNRHIRHNIESVRHRDVSKHVPRRQVLTGHRVACNAEVLYVVLARDGQCEPRECGVAAGKFG